MRPALVRPCATAMVFTPVASKAPDAWLFSESAVMLKSRPALTRARLSRAPPITRIRSRPLEISPSWSREPACCNPRSPADCSDPTPCSACTMTVRVRFACSWPREFLSVSATMRESPREAIWPPVLSKWEEVRLRASTARISPDRLSMRSAMRETTLPSTPVGGLTASGMLRLPRPAAPGPRLSRLAAFRASVLSAWIRPPRLSTAPVAVTARSWAASVPSRLTTPAVWMRASPAATITPSVLFNAALRLIAASPVDVSWPRWLCSVAAVMSKTPLCTTALRLSMSPGVDRATFPIADSLPSARFNPPADRLRSVPARLVPP
ncbi:hypothetical protein LMG6003_05929 [Achromobacter insolitus]|nr:hypothetical protein LMG6003_05929 [Achromobacter insolitus]